MLFFSCWGQTIVQFPLISCVTMKIMITALLLLEVNSDRNLKFNDHAVTDHRLVVISFDGFRWDYLHGRAVTPTFDSIKRKGVHAREGVENVFLTNTLPNHISIATGLYVESHGMMDNIIYDFDMKDNDTYVSIFYDFDAVHDPAWYKSIVEPVWISHQIQNGGTTGVLMWMGGEMTFRGVRAQKFVKPIYIMDEIEEMDMLLDWMTDEEEPVDFAMVYIQQPDIDAHEYGPESVEVTRKIEYLDKALGHFIQRLEELGLSDSTDVMLVSDHGFASTSPDRVIQLDDIIDGSWYKIKTLTMLPGASVSIYPTEGMMDTVYEKLKSSADKTGLFHVYKSRDIPERFHYKSHDRVPPIFVLATLGYSFSTRHSLQNLYKGNHGYDNQHQDMRSFFMAFGPSFLEGVSVETFEIVDYYPLMCHIKGIQPHPNNGSLATVSKLLRHDSIHQSYASTESCDRHDEGRFSDSSCPGPNREEGRPLT